MELMITLVIFGAILAFGIPSYHRYSQTQQLRGTSENLVQTIHLQRSRAMAIGQDVTIIFNTAAPQAWTAVAEGRSSRHALPGGVVYASATPNQLVLSRQGRVNTSGTIVFANRSGNTDTVSVLISGLALVR